MSRNQLETILEKSSLLNVDLSQLYVVHVDDELSVLLDTEEELGPHIRRYVPFTDPRLALDYIITHSREIDFLIIDQFLTHNLSMIEGYQGTDLLRKLYDKKIMIPAAIFSGDHAKLEGFEILRCLNGVSGIQDFKNNVITIRRGNLSPLAYVPKTLGMPELLLSMIGILAMKQEFLDAGYESFFSQLRPPMHTPRYDWVKLMCEKAQLLYSEAERFSHRFAAEISPEADLIDHKDNEPFSKSFLWKCGFLDGLNYTPEEIINFDSRRLAFFSHEFSRTYRSVSLCFFENIEMAVYYTSLYEQSAGHRLSNSEFMEHIAKHPHMQQAFDLIIDFEKSMSGLASELAMLRSYVENGNIGVFPQSISHINSRGVQVVYDSPDLARTKFLTEDIAIKFIVAEISYNAEKIARERGITLNQTALVSSLPFGQLPENISSRFLSYNPNDYYTHGGAPDLSISQFIKYSLSDNAGGFDQPVEHYLQEGVSGTHSTGKGLGLIMNSQQNLFCAIDLINRPGEGVTYDFYFVVAPKIK
jgi:hypothetical protein